VAVKGSRRREQVHGEGRVGSLRQGRGPAGGARLDDDAQPRPAVPDDVGRGLLEAEERCRVEGDAAGGEVPEAEVDGAATYRRERDDVVRDGDRRGRGEEAENDLPFVACRRLWRGARLGRLTGPGRGWSGAGMVSLETSLSICSRWPRGPGVRSPAAPSRTGTRAGRRGWPPGSRAVAGPSPLSQHWATSSPTASAGLAPARTRHLLTAHANGWRLSGAGLARYPYPPGVRCSRVRTAQLRLQGRPGFARAGRRDEVSSHAIGEAGSRRGCASAGGARATWSTRQAPSGSR
jgi:hypothetical protein